MNSDNGASLHPSRLYIPFLLGCALYLLNNFPVWGGWLNPPEGYSPAFVVRGEDIASYFSWARGFASQNLVPNYAAPWQTDPAFFNLPFWLISQFSSATGINLIVSFHLFHLVFYQIASFSLFYAIRAFTGSKAERHLTFLILLVSVPLVSLLNLPLYLAGRAEFPIGARYFVWLGSDGFLHGIGASPLVTLSTGLTLLTFGLLANYIRTTRRRYLALAAGSCLLVASIHVTETFAIGLAATVALVLWRKDQLTLAIRDVAVMGIAVLGLVPHLLLAWNHPWLRELGMSARWQMMQSPWDVLITIGVPGILAIILLIRNISMPEPTDRLLQVWFVAVVVGACVPIMPTPQHLFDGVFYGTAILLARQLSQYEETFWTGRSRQLIGAAFSGLLVLSLSAYGAYLWQGFRDGARPIPQKLFSTVVSTDEVAVIEWMRTNAQSSDLVLAPPANAPWLTTVPMHSFASHWLWSHDYKHQLAASEDFYDGRLAIDVGVRMLKDYGVKYVVVPDGSAAQAYLEGYTPRAKVGSLTVFESPTAKMKSFEERRTPR